MKFSSENLRQLSSGEAVKELQQHICEARSISASLKGGNSFCNTGYLWLLIWALVRGFSNNTKATLEETQRERTTERTNAKERGRDRQIVRWIEGKREKERERVGRRKMSARNLICESATCFQPALK